MHGTISKSDFIRERLRREHAARLAESLPLMAKSIPLGLPPSPDRYEIADYYRRKHATGPVGTYWPLHQTLAFPGRYASE
jgi:hypothetical protein